MKQVDPETAATLALRHAEDRFGFDGGEGVVEIHVIDENEWQLLTEGPFSRAASGLPDWPRLFGEVQAPPGSFTAPTVRAGMDPALPGDLLLLLFDADGAVNRSSVLFSSALIDSFLDDRTAAFRALIQGSRLVVDDAPLIRNPRHRLPRGGMDSLAFLSRTGCC